jgi:hypothetical protein
MADSHPFKEKHGLATSIFLHTRLFFGATDHVYLPLKRRIYPYNCSCMLSLGQFYEKEKLTELGQHVLSGYQTGGKKKSLFCCP